MNDELLSLLRLKFNQILMLFIFLLMNKMCSLAPRIIVIVPRVPIVQSDHYHCYQITAGLQRPEHRGRPGPIFSSPPTQLFVIQGQRKHRDQIWINRIL